MNAPFRLPVTEFHKASPLEDSERMLIKFKASDTKPDRSQGPTWKAERVTTNFIKLMRNQAQGLPIPILDNQPKTIVVNDVHGKSFGFGRVDKDASPNDDEFWVVAELLKEFPESALLYKSIQENKCSNQTSIGGITTFSFLQYDPEIYGISKMLDQGYLHEITVTHPGAAANIRTGGWSAEFGKEIAAFNKQHCQWNDAPIYDASGRQVSIDELADDLGVTVEAVRKSIDTGERIEEYTASRKQLLVKFGNADNLTEIPIEVDQENEGVLRKLLEPLLQAEDIWWCSLHKEWHEVDDDCEEMRKVLGTPAVSLEGGPELPIDALRKAVLDDSKNERQSALDDAVRSYDDGKRSALMPDRAGPYRYAVDFDDDTVIVDEGDGNYCAYKYDMDDEASIDWGSKTPVVRQTTWVEKKYTALFRTAIDKSQLDSLFEKAAHDIAAKNEGDSATILKAVATAYEAVLEEMNSGGWDVTNALEVLNKFADDLDAAHGETVKGITASIRTFVKEETAKQGGVNDTSASELRIANAVVAQLNPQGRAAATNAATDPAGGTQNNNNIMSNKVVEDTLKQIAEQQSELIKRMDRLESPGEKVYKCQFCQAERDTEAMLAEHVTLKHGEEVKKAAEANRDPNAELVMGMSSIMREALRKAATDHNRSQSGGLVEDPAARPVNTENPEGFVKDVADRVRKGEIDHNASYEFLTDQIFAGVN